MDAGIFLAVAVLTGLGLVLGALVFCVRILWQIKGSWDATNNKLQRLVERVTDFVVANGDDHARMDRRTEAVEQRLERHLEWHDRH